MTDAKHNPFNNGRVEAAASNPFDYNREALFYARNAKTKEQGFALLRLALNKYLAMAAAPTPLTPAMPPGRSEQDEAGQRRQQQKQFLLFESEFCQAFVTQSEARLLQVKQAIQSSSDSCCSTGVAVTSAAAAGGLGQSPAAPEDFTIEQKQIWINIQTAYQLYRQETSLGSGSRSGATAAPMSLSLPLGGDSWQAKVVDLLEKTEKRFLLEQDVRFVWIQLFMKQTKQTGETCILL